MQGAVSTLWNEDFGFEETGRLGKNGWPRMLGLRMLGTASVLWNEGFGVEGTGTAGQEWLAEDGGAVDGRDGMELGVGCGIPGGHYPSGTLWGHGRDRAAGRWLLVVLIGRPCRNVR